jgi:hypothetical protein
VSFEATFWLICIVVLSVACVRQLRMVLAMPGEWDDLVSNLDKPKEGEHVADQQDR